MAGRDGRVLVVLRATPPGAGSWTLPGGKVEAGESLAEAVVREVLEETGVCVRVVEPFTVVPLDGEGFSYSIHEHLCTADESAAATRPGDDAADARWVLPAELEALGVSRAVRSVVALGLARLRARSREEERDEERIMVGSAAMRTTHTCPKCNGQEVLFLPQIADRDDNDNVKPLSAHVVHFDWKDDVEVGKLQAYVCHACGYTELYTKESAQLPWEKIPGARLLTPRDPPLAALRLRPPPKL